MSTHSIYSSIYDRLSKNGCISPSRKDITTLISESLRSISRLDPTKCREIEEIIYSMIYHHAVQSGDINISNSLSPPYGGTVVETSQGGKINFDMERLPYALCQVLYTFINEVVNSVSKD